MSALIPALKDEDPTVRWVVAEVLGEIGDADATPPLEALLDDPDEFVREAARVALEQIGSR